MIGLSILLNKLASKTCKLFKRNGSQFPGYLIYDVLRQMKGIGNNLMQIARAF